MTLKEPTHHQMLYSNDQPDMFTANLSDEMDY